MKPTKLTYTEPNPIPLSVKTEYIIRKTDCGIIYYEGPYLTESAAKEVAGNNGTVHEINICE